MSIAGSQSTPFDLPLHTVLRQFKADDEAKTALAHLGFSPKEDAMRQLEWALREKDREKILTLREKVDTEIKDLPVATESEPKSPAGIEINAVDKEGKSALILAAELGFIHCVLVLLDNHADPDCIDKNGKTALIYLKELSQRIFTALHNEVKEENVNEEQDSLAIINERELDLEALMQAINQLSPAPADVSFPSSLASSKAPTRRSSIVRTPVGEDVASDAEQEVSEPSLSETRLGSFSGTTSTEQYAIFFRFMLNTFSHTPRAGTPSEEDSIAYTSSAEFRAKVLRFQNLRRYTQKQDPRMAIKSNSVSARREVVPSVEEGGLTRRHTVSYSRKPFLPADPESATPLRRDSLTSRSGAATPIQDGSKTPSRGSIADLAESLSGFLVSPTADPPQEGEVIHQTPEAGSLAAPVKNASIL